MAPEIIIPRNPIFKNIFKIMTPIMAKNKPTISPLGAENLTLVIMTEIVTPAKTIPVRIKAAGTISGATTLAIKRTGARIKPDINPLAFLRNNHLNYSITWFLLSLSSAIMILIIRRKRYG